jgi:tripartite-type tricarboxylate transporter receptor subunit TctC
MKRILGLSIALAALTVSASSLAQAAEWPTKPIKTIVPFAPGSSADAAGRIIMEKVGEILGQPVVIENRAGAGGTIGSEAVAKSAADGYTVLVHSNSHVIGGLTNPNLRFSPQKDLISVAPVASIYHVFVASSEKPYTDLSGLIEVAQKDPDALNYASAGSGSITHLGGEKLLQSANIKATHIPFKGTPEALTEVLAGRVDFFLAPIGLIKPHVEAGKLRILAISDESRAPDFPDVATLSEQGVKNAETPGWVGVFAPAGTPTAVLEKLNKATNEALQDDNVRSRLAGLALTPMSMDLPTFQAFVEKEFDVNGKLVKTIEINN